MLDHTTIVAIVGAGTMGAGIVQLVATAGHKVLLFDGRAEAGPAAVEIIGRHLQRSVDKGRLSSQERDSILRRITVVGDLGGLRGAGLVIEAIIEDLEVKRTLFRDIEALVSADCILASNSSSISMTAIASALRRPERFVGIHFFNPAPLMALVEIVSGLATGAAVRDAAFALVTHWGKTPVHTKSTPGFIVNRIARPFYGEALRFLQENGTNAATLDALLQESAGFRMGPCALMDLIGHDINFAVTNSVWRSFFHDPRYTPNLLQQALVDAGWLGRKSGRGFYDYGDGGQATASSSLAQQAPPVAVTLSVDYAAHPWRGALEASGIALSWDDRPGRWLRLDNIVVAETDGRSAAERARTLHCPDLVLFDLQLDPANAGRIGVTRPDGGDDAALLRAAGLFQAVGLAVSQVGDVPGMLLGRTLAMLVNEAFEAVSHGIASRQDIDLAMRLGVNYPLGPFAMADRLGARRLLTILENLHLAYGDGHYRPSPLWRREVGAAIELI